MRALALTLVLAALAGCSRSSAARPTPGPSADVVATVDGVPLREADLELRLKAASHGAAMTPEFRANLLDAMVREQLLAARALELGLDADPAYQEAVQQLETQLAALKRRRLAELLVRRELGAKVEVSDATARRWYDENKELLRTELHVQQILVRSEDAIRRAEAALAAGTPFEEVAQATGAAWDLGYVKWQELPDAWRPALGGCATGTMSKPIRGGGNRFWIVRILDRRQGPEVAFEAIKGALVERLRGGEAERRRDALEAALRQKAAVVYRR